MASDIAEAISKQYLANPPNGRYSDIADADVLETIFSATKAGLNLQSAAEAAGVDRITLNRWSQRAEKEPESAFATFDRTIKQLRRQGQVELLHRIRKASEKEQHWTAAAWTLERTDPEQFALRKDDAAVPKVVVNIGSGASDVKVLVLTAATEESQPRLCEHVLESESVKVLTVGDATAVSR